MIVNAALLEPVGPALVATHAGADLRLSYRIRCAMGLPRSLGGKITLNRRHGLQEVRFARARRLADPAQPSWPVRYLNTILVLVPMLAAFAGSREPAQRKIAFSLRGLPLGIHENADSDGARMHAPTSLGWWNALNTVTASLVLEVGNILRLDYRRSFGKAKLVLSAATAQIARVCRRQVADEQLGVISTFCGANFD